MRLSLLLVAASMALTGCQSLGERLQSRPGNPGPCPTALVLSDANRIVEFSPGGERYEDVRFTGEVMNVLSLCSYYATLPIRANLEMEMGFGRGQAAESDTHTFYYFVAVTRRDIAVIHREVFPITVRFRAGEDTVYLRETIESITIPRANDTVAGENFQILVGFELTPEQVAYNRSGQRFVTRAIRPE